MKNQNKRGYRLLGTGLGLATTAAVVFSGVGVANAADATDAAAAIAQAAPESFVGAVTHADELFAGGTAEVALGGAAAVTLPGTSAGALSLVAEGSEYSLDVTLPFADTAAPAEIVDGHAVYDNGNGTSTVPVTKDDGTVQVTTVINNRSAPNEFVYELSVPDNGRITETSEGGVAVLDADQNAVAYIAPAWAKDAGGANVATHYVVDGTTITQVVDTSGTETLFPVVADPQLLTFAWGQGIRFSKSETKSISRGSTNAEAASLLCGLIPVLPIAAACGLAAVGVIALKMGPIRDAAAQNKCSQINVPWGSGPVLWFTYVVNC